jgi:hypothetical protein
MHVKRDRDDEYPEGLPLLTLNLLRQINALHDWRQTNVCTHVKRDGNDEYPEGRPLLTLNCCGR